MSNVNAILNERLKRGDQSSKMAAMAKQSANGNLTSFAGVFSVIELSEQEKSILETLLNDYAPSNQKDRTSDLRDLISITSEVKAINNQAAILHGERIKKAHNILIKYRDGAFTAWLTAAYGNRQTPYNFLQYYEFYEALPKPLRPRLDLMPRQAIYTLASRDAPFDQKLQVVETYNGETKSELLRRIREIFPLAAKDKRRQNLGDNAIRELSRLYDQLQRQKIVLSKGQKQTIIQLLESLRECIAS